MGWPSWCHTSDCRTTPSQPFSMTTRPMRSAGLIPMRSSGSQRCPAPVSSGGRTGVLEVAEAGRAAPVDRDRDGSDLSAVLVTLLKGPVYREDREQLWRPMIQLRRRIEDYVAI